MRTPVLHSFLLIAPATLVILLFFVYPLGFSVYSAVTVDDGSFSLIHLAKAFDLYGKDILFTIIVVTVSILLVLVLSIMIGALINLSTFPRLVAILGGLYRIPLFIPFIVTAQMMRTFLAKNGLMNNTLVMLGVATPLETISFLGWKGIIITFVWKQLAFSTLLISGAMAALERAQIQAARNLGAGNGSILFHIILPQIKPTLGVVTVLSTVSIMSVLSVPLMIGTGSPTMITADMAFRVNSYSDYHVANALGLISYAISGLFAWFYLRYSLRQGQS
jgi:ABC-type sugar transport system permease subunit